MSQDRWIDPDLPGFVLAGKTYIRVRDVQKLWPNHPILRTLVKHMHADPRRSSTLEPCTNDPDLLVACYSR